MEVTSEVHRRGWEIKVGRAREVVEAPEPERDQTKISWSRIIPKKKDVTVASMGIIPVSPKIHQFGTPKVAPKNIKIMASTATATPVALEALQPFPAPAPVVPHPLGA